MSLWKLSGVKLSAVFGVLLHGPAEPVHQSWPSSLSPPRPIASNPSPAIIGTSVSATSGSAHVRLSAKFVAKAREHRRRESGACDGLEGVSAQGFSASWSFIMVGESNPERTVVLKHLAHGLPTRDRQRSYCQTPLLAARSRGRQLARMLKTLIITRRTRRRKKPASEEVQREPYFPFACVAASMRPERPHKDQSSIGLHHQTCPGYLNGH